MIKKLQYKLWGLLALLLIVPVSASAGADIRSEAIKALYIVQMQKFINLGKSSRSIEKICYYEKHLVPANESVGQQIEKYVKTNQNTNFLTVKKFEAISNFTGCDIFYIPADDEDDIKNILAALGNSETVTVSGAPRFILRGGMIGLVMDEDNHVKMEGNLKNAREKNIHIDAQLLELMLRVIQ